MSKMNNEPRKENWFFKLRSMSVIDNVAKDFMERMKTDKSEELKLEARSYVMDGINPIAKNLTVEPVKKEILPSDILDEKLKNIASERSKLIESIEAIEHSRLKHETWQQRQEVTKRIYEIKKKVYALNEVRRDIAAKKKMAQIRERNLVAGLNIKNSTLLKEIEKGISLSNIIKSGKILKSEIQRIVEDDEFIEILESKKKGFKNYWARWKKKYLA